MNTIELLQKVEFVNENCTPLEAKDVITKVIDDQIKFHKLQNLSRWMKNNDCDQVSCNSKITKLKQRKQELIGLIKEAQMDGRKVKLSGDFHLSLED